jgi:hypothetical protein
LLLVRDDDLASLVSATKRASSVARAVALAVWLTWVVLLRRTTAALVGVIIGWMCTVLDRVGGRTSNPAGIRACQGRDHRRLLDAARGRGADG